MFDEIRLIDILSSDVQKSDVLLFIIDFDIYNIAIACYVEVATESNRSALRRIRTHSSFGFVDSHGVV